jgi:hypothetical protein
MTLRYNPRMRTTGWLGFSILCLALGGCLEPQAQPRPVASAAAPGNNSAPSGGAPKRVQLKNVNKFIKGAKKRPAAWNANGTTRMGQEGLEIMMGGVKKAKTVMVQRSNASGVHVRFFNGDNKVAELKLFAKKDIHRDRLVRDVVKTPEAARQKGFDRVRIVPFKEKRYALGAIRLNVPLKKKGKKGGQKRPGAPGQPGAGQPKAGQPKPGQPKPAVQPKPARP